MRYWKSLSLNIFFSILISLAIIYLSTNQSLWGYFWGSLSIPAQIPFSDLKAHIQFYNCHSNGVDIYLESCNLIPDGNAKISTHPKIWLSIVNLFNLTNPYIYNFFVFLTLTTYFSILFQMLKFFKTSEAKIFFFIFLISTTNFILVERFATDILIFILIYVILNTDKKILQGLVIFFGLLLKYYPVFLTSIFLKNKKYLFIYSFLFVLFIIYFYLDEIKLVNNNILEIALIVAYGSRTFAKAFYHLSNEYNFFINENNYETFRNLIIYLSALYSFSLFIVGYKYNCKKNHKLDNKLNVFFIGACSIYIGTFITGSNFDYRLIFLIFTIPYILNIENIILKKTILICYIISLNSFLIQHSTYFFNSNALSYIYYIKALFVYSSKFIILSILSYLLGSYLKEINFFNFK